MALLDSMFHTDGATPPVDSVDTPTKGRPESRCLMPFQKVKTQRLNPKCRSRTATKLVVYCMGLFWDIHNMTETVLTSHGTSHLSYLSFRIIRHSSPTVKDFLS